jgi:hypothetical protein
MHPSPARLFLLEQPGPAITWHACSVATLQRLVGVTKRVKHLVHLRHTLPVRSDAPETFTRGSTQAPHHCAPREDPLTNQQLPQYIFTCNISSVSSRAPLGPQRLPYRALGAQGPLSNKCHNKNNGSKKTAAGRVRCTQSLSPRQATGKRCAQTRGPASIQGHVHTSVHVAIHIGIPV